MMGNGYFFVIDMCMWYLVAFVVPAHRSMNFSSTCTFLFVFKFPYTLVTSTFSFLHLKTDHCERLDSARVIVKNFKNDRADFFFKAVHATSAHEELQYRDNRFPAL